MRVEPDRAYTDGDNAAELSAAYFNRMDEWQRSVLDCWLGRDGAGDPTAMSCGISCPRQNGKNGVIEAFELDKLLNEDGVHILHTAHQVKTEKKAFRRLAAVFENGRFPELGAQLKAVRRTNGEEAIELVNGNTIEYSSRSRGGGRGFDAITVVVYDEAQELTDEHVEALMSTLAASQTGDRQTIYAGTPPSPSCPGDVFARVRAAALSDPGPKTAWHEWGVGGDACPVRSGMPFEAVEGMVYEANPAMGIRLSEEFTRQEFDAMTPDGFARERLGWWAPQAGRAKHPITPAMWDGSAIPKIGNAYRARKAFGVKFSPDGSRYALAGCKADSKGNAAFELVEVGSTARGTRALAEALLSKAQSASCVAVDGQAGAPALCENMAKAPRGYVVRARTADVVEAAGMMVDCLRDGTASHTSDGQAELDGSALGSVARPVGRNGGWGFGSTDAADSTAIEAASLALWAARKSKRNPKRKQRQL